MEKKEDILKAYLEKTRRKAEFSSRTQSQKTQLR